MDQSAYPACAVNHKPEYYCCEYTNAAGATERELFTKFSKPQGGKYTEFYTDGWKKARQVNFPSSQYTPDSPNFDYNVPESVCRIQRVVRVDGTLQDTLQCGIQTKIGNSYDGAIVVNASVADNSRDATVFWTSRTNLRNNNATFPIGVTCTNLMTEPGVVDTAAKKACVSAPTAVEPRFTTFTEAPLMVVFVFYAVLAALLLLWWPLRSTLAMIWDVSAMHNNNHKNKSTWSTGTTGIASKEPVNGGLKYVDDPNVLAIPMLTHRSSDVELRAAADAIEQTGYQDAVVGKVVFAYFVFATLVLVPLMVVLIVDSNSHFSPPLFDPANTLIKVYIVFWVFMAAWLTLLVGFYDRMPNFFRVKQPLDRCQYVHLFNPEASEILMSDRSGISACVRKLQSLVLPRTRRGYKQTLLVQFTEDGHRYVEFQHLRYIYDELYGKFMPGSLPFPETFAQIREQQRDGLYELEYTRRLAIVGQNTIAVPLPSWTHSVANEVFQFFYVYQVMCYAVWYFNGYWQVAIVNMIIIVVVMGINIVSKRKLLAAVLQMTRTHGGVAVQRDGVWQTIKASQLVPGDLVRVAENWDVPCDLVLLKGNVLCDESALTGESMPVQKFAIPTTSREVYDPEDQGGKKYTLFAGAKTLFSGKRGFADAQKNDEILAVVHATGALTVRGQLIQSILYPAKVRFKYDEHLKAFIFVLLVFGIVSAAIAMRFLIDNAGISNSLFAFVFGAFMLSAVVNPLIPVVVTIGQVNGMKRLQRRGIFCLNPERIALCGKVRVFAFDKTGTITKEGLDYRGCLPVQLTSERRSNSSQSSSTSMPPVPRFSAELSDVSSAELNPLMKFALASCHAVGYMDDKLVGNEVELKMFAATNWKLIEEQVMDDLGQEEIRTIVESPNGDNALELLKRFEFDHHRMCMSVIVQDLQTNRRFVFCKGAYEKIQELATPETMPSEYMTQAERLAHEGCYVIGIAYKEIPATADLAFGKPNADRDSDDDSSDDPEQAELLQQQQQVVREDMESGLTLLGLVLFQNELKPDSTSVLSTLKDGGVRSVMITGDNAMTGCYIARSCGMVPSGVRVILGDILAINKQGGKALVWKDIDTLEILSNKDVHKMVDSSSNVGETAVELAVTGPAFNYLGKMSELSKFLFHIRIFSRMTPVEKADCIAEMMTAGAVTGMCGDGGNDCGALRIAHVGVALSDSEASVVSPFTSQKKSIAAVVDVCREGRCTLSTTFGNLKFLIIYGLIGCGLRFTMYSNAVFVAKYSFVFNDGLVLVGLSYAITLAKPAATLGSERPTSSLIGVTTLLSILGQVAIHVVFLYTSVHMLMTQAWYCPFNPDDVDLSKGWLLEDTALSTTLFLVISPQFMISAVSFGFGARYHQPVYRNVFLMLYFCALFGFLLYLALGAPSRVTEAFRIATSTNVVGLPDIPLPHSFQSSLMVRVVINMAAILVFEFLVVTGPLRKWIRAKCHNDQLNLRL
uniref:P-type ATPase A domain-containing protein n=1 Tax=Globisporangium ultimum (strain ATCC 200006 / CBS 805.95 / DAOM BR144) TaxID=431595 RepID=K3WTC0_GLOUD